MSDLAGTGAQAFCCQSPGSRLILLYHSADFPGSSDGKESTCNAGDLGSIPGLGKSPGEGNSYPLQYSGLENSAGATFTWI